MSDLRVLIVEDNKEWLKDISDRAEQLAGSPASTAENYESALQQIRDTDYDLMLVDLSLPRVEGDPNPNEELGMSLLGEIRRSRRNSECGIIIFTMFGNTQNVRDAFKRYAVDDFVDKTTFHGTPTPKLLSVMRSAVMAGRLRQAEARERRCYRLEIEFDSNSLVGSVLLGPDRETQYRASDPRRFKVEALARRADDLNTLLLGGGPDAWRPAARDIGDDIYEAISEERRIHGDLVAARALARRFSDLRLRFAGPAPGLGVPFELLRDEEDYLGLSHVLTRRIIRQGGGRRPNPFHRFIGALCEERESPHRQPLRVLVVGSNSDGWIPAAEAEAGSLALAIEGDLQRLGLESQVVLLSGAEATYARVSEALRDGKFHVFHYAGHGRFDDRLAEVSGLVLADGAGQRVMTADALNQLTGDSDLHLVYLSCCLGARTAGQQGRGDFYGVLDALARADVPLVLGYRWTVADSPAMLLALVFYQMLWRTLSPGEALLHARRSAAMGERGRDDETWASPILLTQTN
jgi:CheY-like chemotaxis protein